MAIVRNNSVTQGFSGMLGNLIVFRQCGEKTIVASRPRPVRKQSALQQENRRRFRDAALFAKFAMRDPQQKAYYWEKARKLRLPNAYTAAITDYMRKPAVSKVDTSRFHGHAGDRVVITAGKKAFPLASVEVTIANAHGIPIANSMALPKNLRKNEWTLRMPVPIAEKETQFIVTAKDHAGNVSRLMSPLLLNMRCEILDLRHEMEV
jgi:hypothetical protein